MKKFAYIILGLSIVGAVISGLLIIQHYSPDNTVTSLFCGGGPVNPCMELSQTKYAELFGIPVAAYGLLFYLFVLFIILIADYAEGRYHAYSLAVLLALSIVSIIADAVLAVILIIVKLPCQLCIATYAVNICILALLVAWREKAGTREDNSLRVLYKEIFLAKDATSDRKAFNASFVIFLFLLPYAIFSTSNILQLKSDTNRPSADQIKADVRSYYQQPAENIKFPDSGIVLGNPEAEVAITVFTDFLCSFCYKSHLAEEYLLSKYENKIKIIYFTYPLDKNCNPHISQTVYKNSCIASRAFLAATEAGIVEQYSIKHFAEYKKFDHNYDHNRSISILETIDRKDLKDLNAQAFQALMNSARSTKLLEEHIALAKKLSIDGTPAIFINNKRINGYRPVQVLDVIIRNELARKNLL
jgi:protein-disulfide isomerase/uncharacterized membrane protein